MCSTSCGGSRSLERATVVKAAVALGGAVVFGYGVRIDSAAARWAGIALFAVALLLRFVMRPPRDGGAE